MTEELTWEQIKNYNIILLHFAVETIIKSSITLKTS